MIAWIWLSGLDLTVCMWMRAMRRLPRLAGLLGAGPHHGHVRRERSAGAWNFDGASGLPVDRPGVSHHDQATSKAPIGAEGVRKLREEAGADAVLVAVGGVTLETAPAILAAGASVIAVVGAIFRKADPAGEFRRWVAALG